MLVVRIRSDNERRLKQLLHLRPKINLIMRPYYKINGFLFVNELLLDICLPIQIFAGYFIAQISIPFLTPFIIIAVVTIDNIISSPVSIHVFVLLILCICLHMVLIFWLYLFLRIVTG